MHDWRKKYESVTSNWNRAVWYCGSIATFNELNNVSTTSITYLLTFIKQ